MTRRFQKVVSKTRRDDTEISRCIKYEKLIFLKLRLNLGRFLFFFYY
jgi:hypothetical protein